MNTKTCVDFNNKMYYKVYNILKLLGLKSGHNGTKMIIKCILIMLKQNNEYISLEEVYSIMAKELKNISQAQIRYCIKYAIDNRNIKKSKDNFEKIFGYEYDVYVFTNKEIIEEIIRVMNIII